MTGAAHEIIVDTDCGIDDALALLYLLGRADVVLAGVTTVFGNCTVDDATRNVGYVLRLAGASQIPVAPGADRPLSGEAHIAHYVHGVDGLGDVVPAAERTLPDRLSTLPATDQLLAWARADPGRYDLVTLGPLTNVGRALQVEESLLSLFRQVVIMGGSGPFPSPGVALMVDANVQNDGAAARLAFAARAVRRVMVGVNVTRGVILDEEAIARLHRSGSASARFTGAALERYADFYRLAWGRRITPVHDAVAAAVAVRPEWITASATGPVNITNDGWATRAHVMQTGSGDPVAWPIEPVPDSIAATEVDAEAITDDLLAVLDR